MTKWMIYRLTGVGADNAAELADNTLDLMVGRELKGDDQMSVGDMRDELYQCESAIRPSQQVSFPPLTE